MEDRQPNGEMHYRFWQRGGGYDRNVFEPATVYSQIEYMHNNPVRRGLCEQAEDWLWSSAADYAGLRTGPVRLDYRVSALVFEFLTFRCVQVLGAMPTALRGHVFESAHAHAKPWAWHPERLISVRVP